MKLKFIIFCICAVFLVYQNYHNYTNKQLSIYYLDIGQGDSSLIKTPDNLLILVDGGPDRSVITKLGEILPVWVRKIDLVVLTHYDLDHLAGLFDVLTRFDVQTIILNEPETNKYLPQKFMQLMQNTQINYQFADSNLDFNFGCCIQIDTLWPYSQDQVKQLESNASSVTFVLKYNNFSGFFGGDLPIKQENLLVDQIKSKIQVIKIGHHGSRTSTSDTFIQNLKPLVAIIPCGIDNRFQHPHLEVLNILNKNNVNILRTDQIGTIELKSDGDTFWFTD